MNADRRRRIVGNPALRVHLCLSVVSLLLVTGCGGAPSKANIIVRKDNQDLREEVDRLTRLRAGDAATIQELRQATSRPSGASLPPERIAELYTTHGLE